jgi:hypothetical protein
LGRAIPADCRRRVARQLDHRALRSADGAPFDANGPGTSDLDLTIVGRQLPRLVLPPKGSTFRGTHTMPLSEEHPDVARVWCHCVIN